MPPPPPQLGNGIQYFAGEYQYFSVSLCSALARDVQEGDGEEGYAVHVCVRARTRA